MKTERIIKNQARKYLSGNWLPFIVAGSVVCIAIILFMNIVSMFAFVFNLVDLNTYEIADNNKMLYVIIASAVEMIFIFISPMINGVIRMAANVVLYEKTEVADMFYFFKEINRYFKTLLLNLALFVIYNIITEILFNAYLYASVALDADLTGGLNFNSTSLILVLSMVVTVAVKVLFFFIVIYYPLSYYALDSSKPVSAYVFGLISFSLRHLGSAIKLTISFLGWILLCFFVVPAIYVLPYCVVSAVNSTRWLVIYDRNRGLI